MRKWGLHFGSKSHERKAYLVERGYPKPDVVGSNSIERDTIIVRTNWIIELDWNEWTLLELSLLVKLLLFLIALYWNFQSYLHFH